MPELVAPVATPQAAGPADAAQGRSPRSDLHADECGDDPQDEPERDDDDDHADEEAHVWSLANEGLRQLWVVATDDVRLREAALARVLVADGVVLDGIRRQRRDGGRRRGHAIMMPRAGEPRVGSRRSALVEQHLERISVGDAGGEREAEHDPRLPGLEVVRSEPAAGHK